MINISIDNTTPEKDLRAIQAMIDAYLGGPKQVNVAGTAPHEAEINPTLQAAAAALPAPAMTYAPPPNPTAAPAAPVTTPAANPAPPVAMPQAYTIADLAKAASGLMDSGKQPQLVALLKRFGADALPSLNTGVYDAFASELRQLGAMI